MVREQILENLNSDNVKVYVVWTPVLREDDRTTANEATQLIEDDRVQQFWDDDKSLGLSFGKIVTLPRERTLAWDVYLIFDREAEWQDQPPVPADWMHQLGIDEKTLDGKKLLTSVERVVRQTGESR